MTAPDGQAATQAPQPVQAASSMRAWAAPPAAGWKRIAPSGQASWQLRHTTLCTARQDGETLARNAQGGAVRSKIGSAQASAQAPQKLHSPRVKSTSG
ncbi:hypothetical protein TSH7_29240 [Azospirillum sp. TSH7]|nr:hypothetical protein TSH7_29240 [Azospirillum sp. TSH7]PWC65650.1 hypothetical protein TSH20_16170 [Azospirillum sp. TSH20]